MKYKTFLGFVCGLFIVVLLGCSSGATTVTHDTLLTQIPSLYSDNAPQAAGTFVGAVADSEFFVGLVVQGETVVAYLCNGTDVGDWLRGTETQGQLDLSSRSGTTLTATLNNGVVRGTVLVGGERPYSFTASPAQEGTSGFFRHTETLNGTAVVAGWVILENSIVGTSSDGKGIALLDRPIGKEEAGGSSGNSHSGSGIIEDKVVIERPEVVATAGAGEEQQAVVIAPATPTCETTRGGCGHGTPANCDALRNQLATAEHARGDLERELSQRGVQNLNDHPAISAAQRSVAKASSELQSNGCG